MATYPTDASITTRPAKNIASTRGFNNRITEYGGGVLKVENLNRRSRRTFELRYVNITELEKNNIESFYQDRLGDYEVFTFDRTHVLETGTIEVRFSDTFRSTLKNNYGGTDYYDVTISLVEV